ncbi:MAG: hypothetical protein WBO44_03300 [Saprospiraceae bacterium]
MKSILIISLVLIHFYGFSTTRTVNNNGSAQFSTIQDAVNASASNDTILVHGSQTAYAAFTITNKKLKIIGPGFSPDKQLAYIAIIHGCTITGAASSGSELQGLSFSGGSSQLFFRSSQPDSIRIIRNLFYEYNIYMDGASQNYKGYEFQGNYIYNTSIFGTTTSTYENLLFQNNWNFNNGGNNYGFRDFYNCINVLFDHNLWFGPSSGTRNCFSNCQSLNLTNNIFVRRDAAANNSFSTFNNNITYLAVNNTPWNSNSNMDAGGNIADQNPQLADQTSITNGTPVWHNLTIATGPANDSGSDGKDMGLLFEPTGLLNWDHTGISQVPYIYSLNISNPTIQPNGTLNIQVEARKNN